MTVLLKNAPSSIARTGIEDACDTLANRFGNRFSKSLSVREQHANTTTWIENIPPDAVVFAQSTQDVQDIVKICAERMCPVIAFGTGTSLEGHVNAPKGGVCIDVSGMNEILRVNADDMDVVVQPGVTRLQLNKYLRDTGLFFPIDPGADGPCCMDQLIDGIQPYPMILLKTRLQTRHGRVPSFC